VKGARVVVQGFGNVGGSFAELIEEMGAKVIAVADVTGGMVNENGLPIAEMSAYAKKNRFIEGFDGGEKISNEELLSLECDLLVPAALENVLTAENANDINARVIVEGANGPTTPEADRILIDRGIYVVPDILANAGGVTVSYFEWCQGLQMLFWTEEEVNQRLEDIMVRAYHEVHKLGCDLKTDMRNAAMALAVNRVAEAIMARGIYP
jgi:glutamate dehydrogenase/leucine dehydrogenase